MTRSRADRHMNTLPLRLNGTEFLGHPPGSLLVSRVAATADARGGCTLHITLCHAPGRTDGHPTAYFPVPAADVVYALPEELAAARGSATEGRAAVVAGS